MRNTPDAGQEPSTIVASNSLGITKRWLVLSVMVLFFIWTPTLFSGRGASAVTKDLTEGRQPDSFKSVPFKPAPDYAKFSHSSPREHRDLMGRSNCGSCHRRSDSSPAPRFPVHKDCTGCHLVQFTAAGSGENPICTICHNKEGVNLPNPALRNFSGLTSFNAEFDHVQHMQGIESARSLRGCAACHTSVGGGIETIPARLGAHETCYTCHSPGGQAKDHSSCGSCHTPGRYSPTTTLARAYRVGFSHAEHGPRQRLSCESCHHVMGRNLPQSRQVSSISTAQHRSNARARGCLTCHDGQRVFGDKGPNFNDCKRCHKGLKFGS
jgi:hypothetical protein